MTFCGNDCCKECGRYAECGGRETCGAYWCFERCGCPGFTEPDAEGNVILDQCFDI